MADTTVQLGADLSVLRRELSKLPNLTNDAAQKMLVNLEKQVNKAERSAKASARRISKLNTKSLKQMGNSAKMAGLAIVGAFAGLTALVQRVADLTNEITDLSTRTGLAADTLAGLRVAAKGSGLEFKTLTRTIAKFPKLLADADKGLSTAVDAFANLGVETHDADGNLRNADETLRDVFKSLSAIEDPTLRAARAADLFGASGTKLLQALGDPASIEAFTEFASQFGADLGPQAAKAAADWQRSIANLDVATQEFSTTFVQAFTGTGGAAEALDVFNQAIIFTGALFEGIIRELGAHVDNMMRLFGSLGTEASAFMALLSGDVDEFQRLILQANEEVATSIGKMATGPTRLIEVFNDAVDETQRWTNATVKLKDSLEGTTRSAGVFTGGADEAAKATKAVGKTAEDASKELEAFLKSLEPMFQAIDTGLGPLRDLADRIDKLAPPAVLTRMDELKLTMMEAADAFGESSEQVERLKEEIRKLKAESEEAGKGGFFAALKEKLEQLEEVMAKVRAGFAAFDTLSGGALGGLSPGSLIQTAGEAGSGDQARKQVKRAAQAGIDFANAVAENIPIIVRTLAKNLEPLVSAIAKSIGPIIQALVRNAPRIAVALVTGIIKGLPGIVKGLIKGLVLGYRDIGVAFYESVLEGVGKWGARFIKRVGKFFKNIGQDVGGAAKKVGEGALEVITLGQAKTSFGDTPGPVRAPMRGLTARFAAGDTVIAARTPEGLARQAAQAGAGMAPSQGATLEMRDGHLWFNRLFAQNVAAGGVLATVGNRPSGQKNPFR